MDKNIGFEIALLARSISLKMSEVLKPFGIKAGEQPFMAQLYRQDGMTQEELTALVRVDKSVTTKTLKALEAKGLILREPNEKDGRSKRVFLTKEAEGLRAPFRKALEEFGDRLTAGLDAKELNAAIACIESMQKALEDE